MPDSRGPCSLLLVLGLVFCVGTIGCKEQPQIQSSDQPAAVGGMEFELIDYQLRYLELTDEDGQTIEYPDPVLAVQVEMTNNGENDFTYEPTHDARGLTEARHFMLFEAPEQTQQIDWETFSPTPVPGVELQEGHWDEQLQEPQTLATGDSLQDYLLFEPPEEDEESLLLSIPPTMHRGEVPGFIQFDYTRPEPEGRVIYEVGDTVEYDGLTFEVTEITQEYIDLEESDEEGFSDEPVLKVAYTLENNSEDTVEFSPRHGDVTGNEGPVVLAGDVDFARVRFPGDTEAVGQSSGTELEAGESIEDFATFERPDDSTDVATFVMPADYFERSGTVRVNFSYQPEEVEEPEELQEDD